MDLYTTPRKSKTPKKEAPEQIVEMVANSLMAINEVVPIPTLPNATTLLTIAWIWYPAKDIQSIDGIHFRQSVADMIAKRQKVSVKR